MENYVEMPVLDGVSREGMSRINEVLPSFDFSEFVNSITSGGNIFESDKILNSVFKIFATEMHSAIRILAVIFAIVLISSVLENLRVSVGKGGTLNPAFISIALICGLAGEIFKQSCNYASGISDDITKIMWAMLPVMMTLVSGCGYTTTGVIAHPVMVFMCNVFGEIMTRVLIPLSVTYLAISLVDMINDSIELGKFRELIKKIYNFILGFIMTLFTGLLSIGSYAGVALDSVGARGVKFAVSNMVPFVGRSISDAMGAVASTSLLLKNAVGITGIVCMIGLCIIPVMKVAATVLCIRIVTAVSEPVADKKTVQVLSCVGDSLSMVNAAVIATMLMMIIAVGIVMGIKG